MRRVLVTLTCVLACIIWVSSAAASEERPTVDEISRLVICPTCSTTLDHSDSPAADRMRDYVSEKVEAGWTRQQILDGLVAEYGGDESILATPRRSGARGVAAWGVPVIVGGVLMVIGLLTVRRWRRRSIATSAAIATTATTERAGPDDV